MPKAVKLYPFYDIQKYKKKGCLDTHSEQLIKKYITQNKNILVLGNNKNALPDFMHGLAFHAFRLHHDPMIIPTVAGVNLPTYFKSATWKNNIKQVKKAKQCMMAVNYKGTYQDFYPYLKSLGNQFDVVIDMRNFGTKKQGICQIYEKKGNQWLVPYLNTNWFDPVKSKFTA